MNKKVIFICKKRMSNYGVSVGLVNSAKFVSNFLKDNNIDSEVLTAIDANGIDRIVYLTKPSHVILEAIWCPPYKLEELVKKYPYIKWSVRIHSKIPFLAHEGIAIPWISEYHDIMLKCKNLSISGNSKQFAKAIKKSMGINVDFTPNMYYPHYDVPKKISTKNEIIDIGCFGAVRPFKNHLLQAMAAIEFGNRIGKKIRFHINGKRTEQNGNRVVKNLYALFDHNDEHELIDHNWQSHEDFLKLVSKMDIGMQISFSETYNIVSADFTAMDIPILVSNEIYWMPWFRKTDPNDFSKIVRKLKWVYRMDNPISRWWIKWSLKRDTKKAGKTWIKYIK